MEVSERFKKVIDYFTEHMPVAETELEYTNPYELIVAVILSAQCTDKRVNMITPNFYRTFPDPYALSAASREEVLDLIKSCSYPNNKAKHLIGMAKDLVEKYDGLVPDTLEELQTLPGVGRKTANVVLSVVFEKPAMAVDTHVFRVSRRLGLTRGAKNPYEAELQLIQHIPEDKIPLAHHWLILHGRYTCTARKPKCTECGLTHLCDYYATAVNN